jgi:hypothetical protein
VTDGLLLLTELARDFIDAERPKIVLSVKVVERSVLIFWFSITAMSNNVSEARSTAVTGSQPKKSAGLVI